ncbi:hypothetical protein MKW94_028452, partial [Papaver nudicaule]|nr:hypothetical protein [Papaver nudicaule]
VPSATVKVTGLSKRATAEDLYQILAEWGPLHNVQVIQERNSSSHGGIAFINFPSVVNAGMMMSALGYGGLVVDGAELRFEYSYKKIKSKNKQMRAKQSSQRRRRQRAIERDTINGPARLQRDEEKVLAEVVEEGKAEGSEQGGEVGESEVVEGEGEAEHSEEEGKVGDSEAEDVDEEAEGSEQGGEVGDSEADEVERDVEDSEVDGEAGDREADRMLNEEGEVRNNDVVDMDEGEGEVEVEDEYGEETEEELELGMVSTKKRCIAWTKKETKWLKKKADLLSGQRKWSVPWGDILILGSHIFHPERTAEDLREKDRRMRGDTQRERTKRRR